MTTALTFHDILFATDFSEVSRLAGQTAADLARIRGEALEHKRVEERGGRR